MLNEHLIQALSGIRKELMATYEKTGGSSSATKGRVREGFVNGFLKKVLTPQYRFGSGETTDQYGNRSGQLDVVIEYPFVPSVPLGEEERLYLAESIAAVVEVKSDLASQFGEVKTTASKLAEVRRNIVPTLQLRATRPNTPMFGVGYTGWKNKETIERHLNESAVDGLLVIDPGIFVGKMFEGISAQGPSALWALIMCLHHTVRSPALANSNLAKYLM